MTGVIRILSRGFGFLPQTGGPDLFAAANLLTGILDADQVSAQVVEGNLTRVTLTRRGRRTVVADTTVEKRVEGERNVRVDSALGNLSVNVRGNHIPGHAVLIDLEEGRILEDLGPRFEEQGVVRRMLGRYQLPHQHESRAQAEAQIIQGAKRRNRNEGRRDLRDTLVLTIDSDHSTDLDDAVAASPGADGAIRVWVHIADVAEHVKPGTVIDQEAAKCPTSIYLPQKVRHMLPDTLAGQALSLIPHEDRDVLTVEMRVDAEGHVRSVDVYESTIRSATRLSYTSVASMLRGTGHHPDKDVADTIRYLQAAAIRLGQVRASRGGVDAGRIDPEPAGERGEDIAHLLIERIMVATNEAVATWCDDRGLPTLYRTHDTFTPEAAAALEEAAEGFGLYAGLNRPVSSAAFAALAAQAFEAGLAPAFWDSTYPLLARAQYTTSRGIHFGLGSPGYVHFTSPLRRYADLLTHRMIKGYLGGARSESAYSREQLEEHALVINEVTRAAAWAERDATAYSQLADLKPRQVRSATVISTSGRALRVRLDSGALGTLPKGTKGRIGQHVKVRIRSVDALRGTLELALADKEQRAGSKPYPTR